MRLKKIMPIVELRRKGRSFNIKCKDCKDLPIYISFAAKAHFSYVFITLSLKKGCETCLLLSAST